MESFSNKIVDIIIKCNAGESQHREWYIYFVEQKISQIGTYSVLLLISLMLNRFIEAVIFLVFWHVLRCVTGGYHANTRIFCFFISIGLFLTGIWGLPFIIKKSPYILLGMIFVTFVVVFICAPVIHPNLYQEIQHKKKLRCMSLLVICLENIVIAIGLLSEINYTYIVAACSATFLASIFLLYAKIVKQEGKVFYEDQNND